MPLPRPSTVCCSAGELDITVPATPSVILAVTEGVMTFLEADQWLEDDLAAVELALQEALANGVRHGCKGDPTKRVHCSVTCDVSGSLQIVVRDEGAGFDATAVPSPLADANVLKPSGRGVFLMTRLMDAVSYADGGREVQMLKHLRMKNYSRQSTSSTAPPITGCKSVR